MSPRRRLAPALQNDSAMRILRLLAPSLLIAAACSGTSAEDDGFSFDDFVDGKGDTGYLGSRAAEIEATFNSKVRVPVPGKSQTELEAIAAALRANPKDFNHSAITDKVTLHGKFARNALRASKFNLNLEGGDPSFSAITVEPGALVLEYQVKVESLVKYRDLEDQGKTPEDLVGQQIDMKLPLVIDGLLEKVGVSCSSDFDASGAAVPTEDLRADNMFYYWHPERMGCSLGASDLVAGSYKVTSSTDQKTVYPEYDKLVADGKLQMVQLFGQITHGDLLDNDLGWIAYRDIKRFLMASSYQLVETLPNNTGVRLAKTLPNGLKVEMLMLSPVNFADHADRDQANRIFKEAIRSHELVYYAGHAFYGSLTVLDDADAYPADTYQVIFMDACWSYAYYTKQVFRNKATAADPTGWVLADVVNNTEPGITGSERTAHELWKNLIAGADAKFGRKSVTKYSWNNLIKFMNEHAERRAEARGEDNPEIYGVSGVRTNVFKP